MIKHLANIHLFKKAEPKHYSQTHIKYIKRTTDTILMHHIKQESVAKTFKHTNICHEKNLNDLKDNLVVLRNDVTHMTVM